MCMPKAPSVPSPVDRQAAKMPDQNAQSDRSDMVAQRRRALMATVLTSPQGALGSPVTTAKGTLG